MDTAHRVQDKEHGTQGVYRTQGEHKGHKQHGKLYSMKGTEQECGMWFTREYRGKCAGHRINGKRHMIHGKFIEYGTYIKDMI